MLANTFTCPRCRRTLQTAAPPPAGQQVVCSACGVCFTPVPPTPAPLPPNAGALPDWLQPVPAPTQPATTATAPPPPPPAEPPRRHLGLLAAVVGGLLLLAGASVLAVHLAAKDDRREVAGGTPARDVEPPRKKTEPDRPADPPRPTPRDDPPAPPPRRSTPAAPPPAPPRYDPPPVDPVPVKVAPPARPAEPAWLPREDQERVNKAIAKGVEHLKRVQMPEGTWSNRHALGLAALPGLTLLECGVPATDPHVQKAAAYVRQHAPKGGDRHQTYQVSLSILFLDRLGDPRDEKLIRSLALRLVAAQTPNGGWSYPSPRLSRREERDLLVALEKTRPTSALDLFVPGPDGKPPAWFVPVGKAERRPPAGGVAESTPDRPAPGSTVPLPERRPGATRPGPGGAGKKPLTPKEAINKLPPRLRNVPALQPPDRSQAPAQWHPGHRSDNSNTQFAILALWAAQRHNLPLERALALIVQRFRTSQARDGGWNYIYIPGGGRGTPAMTGAGLLGLAVGHGLAVGDTRGVPKKPPVKDQAIEDGLKALSAHIGKPLGASRFKKGRRAHPRPEITTYFLWTVERVGVLYNTRTIGEKDWYAWGAELLLDSQQPNGSWRFPDDRLSTPRVDTCFALLFLKRANLASDLSRKLEFAIEGKGGP